jgi:hypothetical protein
MDSETAQQHRCSSPGHQVSTCRRCGPVVEVEPIHPSIVHQLGQTAAAEPGWAQLTSQSARRQSAGLFNYESIRDAHERSRRDEPGPVTQVDYSMEKSWYVVMPYCLYVKFAPLLRPFVRY